MEIQRRQPLFVYGLLLLGAILLFAYASTQVGHASSEVEPTPNQYAPIEAPAAPVPTVPTTVTLAFDIPTPVVEPHPPSWDVSESAQFGPGNMLSVVNYLTENFQDEVDWLVANYTEGWPFGKPDECLTPYKVGKTVAIAIATNCWRECGGNPCVVQGIGDMSGKSTTEVLNTLANLGTRSGRAFGIIQWDSGRRLNFVKFCKASNLDPCALETQLHYMAYEAYCSAEARNYHKVFSTYANTEPSLKNVTDCAELFRATVERGGLPGHNALILTSWGGKWSTSWGEKPAGGWYQYAIDNSI